MTDPQQVMALPIAQELVREAPVMHLSYTGLDGGPRVIPIAYLWEDQQFRLWTIPTSAKVRALLANPRVALSIDVTGPPMRLLLARGIATLSTVEGVPDGYLAASHRNLPEATWAAFDAQVGELYESMTAITISLDWARLIDFETTAPRAVEELIAQRAGR